MLALERYWPVLPVIASLLVASAAGAEPSAPLIYPAACGPVSAADFDRAHTLFLSGKQFLEESKYDKAVGYFLDSYSVNCNLPEILVSIATVLERKGDKAEAVRALREYLLRAPATPDREKIERRIHNLQELLATTPAAPSPEASRASVPPAGPPEGHREQPAAEPSVAPWIVVAVGGALLIGGVALTAAKYGPYEDAYRACGGSQACSASKDPTAALDVANANRDLDWMRAGTAIAGVGLAAVAGGVLWRALTPAHARTSPQSISFVPLITPAVRGLAASVSF